FDYMGSDAKVVTQKIIQVIGLVNTMFSKFKLTVTINSIEIWSKENRISLPKEPRELLVAFLSWKQNHKPQHISYLLVFQEQPASIGALYPGEVCRADFDAAVALYPKGLSLESYSVIVTQLLSLGMGLTYDNPDTCHCMGDVCLMTPKAIYSGGMKEFSTCSLDDFKSLSVSKNLECLRDWPVERRTRRKPRRICGNGIVEGKEQCDCGTTQNCTHKDCCDPLLCRLKPNAICGSGACCTKKCKIKAINSLCRKKRDECDFAEYCDGTSPFCVPDTYARNGEFCDSGGAFCYEGVCRNTDQQCTKLLGKGVKGAPFGCYDEINSRGDKFGNCITQHCRFENVLCGKLVCTWPFKTIFLKPNMSAAYTHVRDDICISLYRSHGLPKKEMTGYKSIEDRDETFVEDGVICGPEMFCMKMVCRERRFLTNFSICNPSRDCLDHGVCNNFHHCHCDDGFAPPTCEKMKGQFGSIDDGHLLSLTGQSSSNLIESMYNSLTLKFWRVTMSHGTSLECWGGSVGLYRQQLKKRAQTQGPRATYHRYINCHHCGKASSHIMLPFFLALSCLGQLITAGQDSETPLVQTTVPQKIENSTNNAKAADTHGHCFYQGHAAEIPASIVTLSTCSGLRGLLQLENITYGIEPLETSATFEHIIYQIKNNKIDYSPLKENLNPQHESQSYRILVKPEKGSNVSLMKRILNVKVIMDKAMFDHMGSEMGVAVQKVVHIFGLINTMFSQVKMAVMLMSLEIWSDQNKIETDGDADEVLQRFLLWKQKQASERARDITYLLLHSQGIKVFSSCSLNGFKQLVSQPELDCLQNTTVADVVALPQAASCGNGILEGSEECDCGPPEIAERGRLCRKSKDLCDFPEFCNGVSEFCVPDTKAADLEPCNDHTAYCYDAKGPNYLCIQEVNIQNDKFGNCHGRCNYSAIFCGKVACIWDRSEIIQTSKYDVQYTYIGGHVCVSAHLRDTQYTDDTYVHDGTICGGGKVCNNLHNCHCDAGYAPPECDMTPSSPGGSFDDGFWLPYGKSTPLIVKQRGARYKKGLLISFYVFLPFLIMFAICVIKQNVTKGSQHKEET
ncbi:hypothetical protein STEG23_007149, partial [Scotinomys teguina]